MQRAIITSKIGELLDDELRQWYDDFAKANEDGNITEQEYDKLQDQWDSLIDKGLDLRDKLGNAFDWGDSSGSQQEASKGYSVSMDQDTGNAIVMRVTGIQMTGLSMDDKLEIIQANSFEILQAIKNNGIILIEMRNLSLEANGYLQSMEKYTKVLPQIANDIAEVKRNTTDL